MESNFSFCALSNQLYCDTDQQINVRDAVFYCTGILN